MKKAIRKLSFFLSVVLLTAVFAVPDIKNGDAANTAAKEWKYIYFGSYPQSEVTDEETIAAIAEAIEEAFEAGNITYGDQGVDITVDGVQYRRLGTRYFRWDPIKWRVLKDEGETLFVMACRGLDAVEYQPNDSVTFSAVTWETSSLRSWMNRQFPANAFTDDEWDDVVAQAVKNASNPDYGTAGGNDTQDKVFALSYDEATNSDLGFRSEPKAITTSRMIIPTDYACARRVTTYENDLLNTEGNKFVMWWLRSPGRYDYYGINVSFDGSIDSSGFFSNTDYAAVPAMHIAASSEFIRDADATGEVKQLAKAPAPTSSVPSGSEVALSSKVFLSCAAENTTIYYTVDGSKPSKHSTKYSDCVWIGSYSMVIKAIAIGGDYEESDVAVFQYTVKKESTPTGDAGGGGNSSDNENGDSQLQGETTETAGSGSSEENGKTSSSGGSDEDSENSDNDISSEKEEPAVGTELTDTTSCGVYKVTSKKNNHGTVEYVRPVNPKVSKAAIPTTITWNGVTYQVTSIGRKAFENCEKLTTVTIGKHVASIGKNVFYHCNNLKNITIKTTKLTTKNVGGKAFTGIAANAVIKVPKSKLTAYKKLLRSKGAGNKVTIKK